MSTIIRRVNLEGDAHGDFISTALKMKRMIIIGFGDGTHQKKQQSVWSRSKGMTPIEKNIHVVDALGNEYEPTYPKRANGLVKHGRAKFINATTICLTDPPTNNMEGMAMSENNNSSEKVQESANSKANTKYTMDYILEQIERIASKTDYLNSAVEALHQMPDGENAPAYSPGNVAGQAKAQSLADAVRSREATNQRLLELYEKMYDDLKGQPKPANDFRKVEELLEWLKTYDWGPFPGNVRESIQKSIFSNWFGSQHENSQPFDFFKQNPFNK